MTALPIAERELRAASRRASTYWGRFGFAFIAAGVGGLMLYTSQRVGLGGASGQMVRFWSMFLCLYFLARGIRLTADSLSRERRDGTLGLLFLTGLKAHEVILAKLIPPLVYCVGVILAFCPVLTIGLLLGGIRGPNWRASAAPS